MKLSGSLPVAPSPPLHSPRNPSPLPSTCCFTPIPHSFSLPLSSPILPQFRAGFSCCWRIVLRTRPSTEGARRRQARGRRETQLVVDENVISSLLWCSDRSSGLSLLPLPLLLPPPHLFLAYPRLLQTPRNHAHTNFPSTHTFLCILNSVTPVIQFSPFLHLFCLSHSSL
jgi:hypothetical protein